MNRPACCGLCLIAVIAFISTARAESPSKPAKGAVKEILEDDAAGFIKLLTFAQGTIHVENKDRFTGSSSVGVTGSQCFSPAITGWNFPIVEKPKEGEYRFMRFAWKKLPQAGQQSGIMLKLCSDLHYWRDQCYVAGPNTSEWKALSVADAAPQEWQIVTRDVFQDFGALNITGIAFTPISGTGLFDHVYLGRTIEDLDRIDATGLTKKPFDKELKGEELEALWSDLAAADASKAYIAQWTLVAGSKQSASFLQTQLAKAPETDAGKKIDQFIKQLDDDQFGLREKASAELEKYGQKVVPKLRQELAGKPSPEVLTRVRALLEKLDRGGPSDPEAHRAEKALLILELANSTESKKALEALAKGDGPKAGTAKAILKRMSK